MMATQLLFTHVPLLNRLLHSVPIGWDAWWRILATGVAAYLLVEVEKRISRRRTFRANSAAPQS